MGNVILSRSLNSMNNNFQLFNSFHFLFGVQVEKYSTHATFGLIKCLEC